MALPALGKISARDINVELGRTSNATFSIDTAENGGYAPINLNSTSRPSSANPARYSEWRGYDHSAGASGPDGPFPFGFSPTSFDDACRNYPGRAIEIWLTAGYNETNWYFDACELFIPGRGGWAYAPAGFYSRDDFYRQWGGSGWIAGIQECRI